MGRLPARQGHPDHAAFEGSDRRAGCRCGLAERHGAHRHAGSLPCAAPAASRRATPQPDARPRHDDRTRRRAAGWRARAAQCGGRQRAVRRCQYRAGRMRGARSALGAHRARLGGASRRCVAGRSRACRVARRNRRTDAVGFLSGVAAALSGRTAERPGESQCAGAAAGGRLYLQAALGRPDRNLGAAAADHATRAWRRYAARQYCPHRV